MEDNLKYDVAFSFVQQDEPIAFKLYKLLKDRLSCFIYSEEQKRLAGADGEHIFNSVFSKEARIVAVLYRDEWGKTNWTRIEQTAIKNKGFDDGYDFVILIPTEKNFTAPQWLPKNRIWIGLERWGIEGAAVSIEARVQEFGGVIKFESISEKASRIDLEIQDKKKREQILDSNESLNLIFNELEKIVAENKKIESDIKKDASNWNLRVRSNSKQGCDIISYGYILTFKFYKQYNDSPRGAFLLVALVKGYFDHDGRSDIFANNEEIDSIQVRFDINDLDQYGWSLLETRKNFKTTNKLVEHWFNKLITYATKERKSGNF